MAGFLDGLSTQPANDRRPSAPPTTDVVVVGERRRDDREPMELPGHESIVDLGSEWDVEVPENSRREILGSALAGAFFFTLATATASDRMSPQRHLTERISSLRSSHGGGERALDAAVKMKWWETAEVFAAEVVKDPRAAIINRDGRRQTSIQQWIDAIRKHSASGKRADGTDVNADHWRQRAQSVLERRHDRHGADVALLSGLLYESMTAPDLQQAIKAYATAHAGGAREARYYQARALVQAETQSRRRAWRTTTLDDALSQAQEAAADGLKGAQRLVAQVLTHKVMRSGDVTEAKAAAAAWTRAHSVKDVSRDTARMAAAVSFAAAHDFERAREAAQQCGEPWAEEIRIQELLATAHRKPGNVAMAAAKIDDLIPNKNDKRMARSKVRSGEIDDGFASHLALLSDVAVRMSGDSSLPFGRALREVFDDDTTKPFLATGWDKSAAAPVAAPLVEPLESAPPKLEPER